MFLASTILNKLPKLNYVHIIRNHRKITKRRHVGGDPGIRYRKQFGENNQEVEELADEDFDLEADFMNVGASYSEHVEQMKRNKEREMRFTARRKYFKEKFPNFLTWSDKEQIRHLYRTDPEEWSIEKLSDGFPALPNVVAKIATANWTITSESKMHSHDETVKQNWKSFKEGKYPDLPKDLVEHLKKFINRDINIQPFKTPNKKINTNKSMLAPNVKTGNEFSNIITSYERLKGRSETDCSVETKQYIVGKPPKRDTVMAKTNVYGTHLTLDKMREKIEAKAKYKDISQDEQLMLRAFREESVHEENKSLQPNDIMPKVDTSLTERKDKNSEVSVIVKNTKDYSHLVYPEHITIPKKLFQRGYTYKLNDCYYDDDGEFLYRVPGMDK